MRLKTMQRLILAIAGAVTVFFALELTLCFMPAYAAVSANTTVLYRLPGPYDSMLNEWTKGYWFWRITYTLLSAAAVTFPALIAAGVPRQENRRQLVAATAAATIAITTFMQAGEKATAHEHAYVCMEIAAAAYETGVIDLQTLRSKADACSAYIDYDYLDVERSRDKTENLPASGSDDTQSR